MTDHPAITQPHKYFVTEVLIIGFGKGGKTLAATLGNLGRRVVMVEQSPAMYGGTCINIGCVPTKSMVYRAEHFADRLPSKAIYFQAVNATTALTSDLRATNFSMLDSIPSVEVLTGTASFRDEHTVLVQTTESVFAIRAETIVVNTGSEAIWPDVPGLKGHPLAVTSTEMLSIEQLPEKLVILGGGYIGLEFAAMYAAYGSQVTVLERHHSSLSGEDEEIADTAVDLLSRSGVELVTSAEVVAVNGPQVRYRRDGTESTATADCILVASGRRPATAGLALENAGVVTRSDGTIEVDEHLRTSQPHIFAIGDVNGGPQFTNVSLDDYRVVLDQLSGSGSRRTSDRFAVPYVLFITPPLARVGLTERQARQSGHSIKVASLRVAQMATVPRARIVGRPEGMMKVVVDADSDQILGAALLSYDAHEMINVVSLAMRHGISSTELRDGIYTHPSMTEAFNQLLGALSLR